MDYKIRNNKNFYKVQFLHVIPEGSKKHSKINQLNIEFKLLTFT